MPVPLVTITLNPAIDRVIEAPGFNVGAHQQVTTRSRQPGGKGVNVSRVLAILGDRSTAAGLIGDADAAAFEAFLRQSHSDLVTLAMTRVAGNTRENITILDPLSGTDTHLRDAGFTASAQDLSRFSRALEDIAVPPAVVCFAGSTPPGVSPLDFAAMVAHCHQRGLRVAVDCSGAPLVGLRRQPLWLLKLNRKELGEYVGYDIDDEAVLLSALHEAQVIARWVAITLGEDGAVACGPGGAVRARLGQRITVRNTVGCGDAFLAGLLHGLCTSDDLYDALRWAVACGACNAQGVAVASFDRNAVDRLLGHVAADAVRPDRQPPDPR